jgi:hypothetical protein
MNKRVRKHLAVLQFLAKSAKPNQAKAVLKCADRDLVGCLCECIQNVAMGNVAIDKGRKKKLAKHKQCLRQILDKGTKLKKKRKLLVQSGGFLPLLLAPIIGIAGSLIGDAISGAINRR